MKAGKPVTITVIANIEAGETCEVQPTYGGETNDAGKDKRRKKSQRKEGKKK